ncbi:MAG: pentapeptide repeat-containing protein, partial [Cyanobacteria bacterium P01_G01_bin.38]
MNAQDVLARYAKGERNFRGANLRGANFKGQDLSGADFSGADIRGANFTNAILQSACFRGATAGLTRRSTLIQLIFIAVFSTVAGLLESFAGAVLGFYLLDSSNSVELIAGVVGLVVIVFVLFAIARQGFTVKALGSIVVVVTVAFMVAAVIAGAIAGQNAATVAAAIALAVAGAAAGAITGAMTGAGAIAGAAAISVTGAGAVAGAGTGAIAGAMINTFAGTALSLYVAQRSQKGDEKFAIVRTIGINFKASLGTSFSGANLAKANFSQSCLRETNFANSRQRSTTLTCTCWRESTKLDHARLGTSILRNSKVRDLLITLNGRNKDFAGLNLRGANLYGADLKGANLKRAIISEADLSRAVLEDINLTEIQAVGTDFTHAYLTGATLEAWNIDSTTVLKDIDCRYIFLREQPNALGDRERRPHDPNKTFQPGDFEKFFKEVLDEVQILIRNGVNPDAFR